MLPQNWQDDFAETLNTASPYAEGATPLAHLQTYYHDYQATLIAALKKTFSLTYAELGDEAFSLVAKSYITQYPPSQPLLHAYGEYFSMLLSEEESTQHISYLSELADYEWSFHLVNLSPATECLTHAQLDIIQQENPHALYLSLHPAVRLLEYHSPILNIISPNEPANAHEHTYLLLHRPANDVCVLTLTLGDYTFLNTLADNQPLGTAIQKTLGTATTYPFETKLQYFTDLGLFSDITCERF